MLDSKSADPTQGRMKEEIGTATVSITYTKFGPAKRVPVPPASDTADLTAAIKKAAKNKP
ncbi:hypothetical protein [Streptomyces sp. NPDC050738]|uniref:hypothetical protein n=1 Tax=Streptomyces sp. NPDC050738 TaxID=3154744 RepID=UPI0034148E63